MKLAIAVTSWRNRRVIHPRCSCALRDLVTLCTLSLRPRYDQRASAATVPTLALLSRFRYALGALANSRPGSSALLKLVSLFLILGPILSGSILMYLKNEELSSMLIALITCSWSLCPYCSRMSADNHGQTQDLGTPTPSCLDVRSSNIIIQHNKSPAAANVSIVDIQLNINQLNFRLI